MANLYGTGIGQIPTNGMLGNLAFQDKAYVSVDKVGIGTTFVDSGTAGQILQVYGGGAYVSGSVGIGTTNPTSALSVVGDVSIVGVSTLGITTVTNLTAQQLNVSGISTVGFITATNIWNAGITTSSRITLNGANNTADGGGQIYLNGATGNRIDFNTNGVAAPSFTTRSAGTKIVLYPNVGASAVDFAFGIEGSAVLWSSVPQNSFVYAHRWYGGTTALADLKGSGELVIGSTSLTGTSSQRLQVTGGGYFSSSVGIGTTNPTYKVQIDDIATTGAGLLVRGGGAGSDIAKFERNVGGVGNLTINCASSAPQLQFNSSLNTFAVGVNTAYFEIADNSVLGTNTRFVITDTGNIGINSASPTSRLDVVGDAKISGVVTAIGGFNIGIQSAGVDIATGVITAINFIGSGNTFSYNASTKTVSVSIAGGGGSSASSGYANTAGVSTSVIGGIGSITQLQVTGVSTFSSNVLIPSSNVGIGTTNPTASLTVSGSLDGNAFESYELDDLSPATNGIDNTFVPRFNYDQVTITNPFRLMITVNGILQSAFINNTDFVYQSNFLGSNNGYTIDSDNNIKFTESIPSGSDIVARVLPGSITATKIRYYPFKPIDILLGY